MSLRTLMQAGPIKATELFAKLSETSEGAVKTREKLFADLKAELELHTSLEEQHLFPVLRRNAETKDLVIDAIKDNKDLRAKLAELEALPKADAAFPERLKELQKTFRQHARDDKRELLPAVQRALSEEQVQTVAEKIEAGVAAAEKAKHDEAEARRAKVRQEREEAERQAAREEAAAERKREAAAEQARQADQEAARQAQEETEDRLRAIAQTVARTATAAQTSTLQVAKVAGTGAERIGSEIRNAAATYNDVAQSMAPDFRAIATLPGVAAGAMTEIRSAWMEWMAQTTRAGAQISQGLLCHVAEQQQRFAAEAMKGWLEHNARVARITMNVAQESFKPFSHREVKTGVPSGRA